LQWYKSQQYIGWPTVVMQKFIQLWLSP